LQIDTANEWYITGVQLEAGTTASDFEFLPYDMNLQRCQRYCYTFADYGSGNTVTNRAYSAQYSNGSMSRVVYPTQMRALPSTTYSVVGATIDSDNSNISMFQVSDNDDLGFLVYDLIAEAEL
jgi:hypothetical protein